MRGLPLIMAVVLAIGAWSGVAGYQHASSQIEAWQEIAWPFPRDGWPAGRAFHCATELCGEDVELTVRPKLGFCNCATGVADDGDLEQMGDLGAHSWEPAATGVAMPLHASRSVVNSLCTSSIGVTSFFAAASSNRMLA